MSKPNAFSDVSLEMISSIMGWSILRWSSASRHDMESIAVFDALESEQYGTSFGRENGTVILNAMTVAMINEDCCYRDPLGVFRTVSVEWDVSWESISYGEILIVVCDGWRVRLPRCGELEDEGHVVQFDPQALKMGTDPEAEGPNGRGL